MDTSLTLKKKKNAFFYNLVVDNSLKEDVYFLKNRNKTTVKKPTVIVIIDFRLGN